MSVASLWVVLPTTEIHSEFSAVVSVTATWGLDASPQLLSPYLSSISRTTTNFSISNKNRKGNHSCSSNMEKKKKINKRPKFSLLASMVANHDAAEPMLPTVSSERKKVYDMVLKQVSLVNNTKEFRSRDGLGFKPDFRQPRATTLNVLTEACDRCGEVSAEYAKTFYSGTLLMTPEKRKAIWAIDVWCRRTDEFVDGPNASHITPTALDIWESRLEDLFRGCPFDMLDAALSDAVSKFPIDIQLEL